MSGFYGEEDIDGERGVQEAAVMVTLRHTNIVRFYGTGQYPGSDGEQGEMLIEEREVKLLFALVLCRGTVYCV